MDKENRSDDNFEDLSLKKNFVERHVHRPNDSGHFPLRLKNFLCVSTSQISKLLDILLHVYNITKNTTLFTTYSPKSYHFSIQNSVFNLFYCSKE